MPKTLRIGDKIKLLSVPTGDIEDKKRREKDGGLIDEFDFYSADIIEQIIQQQPIVVIDEIDEFAKPWFSVELLIDGERQHHSLAVIDSESWEKIEP